MRQITTKQKKKEKELDGKIESEEKLVCALPLLADRM